MNKRDFVLRGCTALAAGVAFSTPALAQQATAASLTRRLERLPDLASGAGFDHWSSYVGERFAQPRSDGASALVLRRVDRHLADGPGEQFTLLFAAPAATALPAGTHRLRHHTGQQVPIYLQQAGADADGSALLRADFSLLA